MMYSRAASDIRKVSEMSSSERPRSSWESPFAQPLRSYASQPHRSPTTTRDVMDPESSDSDVSVGGGDEYRFASPLTAPVPLPPPPSKHALESSDAVSARLDELQRVEEHNIKKYDLLKAKRNRKDEKIRRKREAQDKKWATIMDARQRRDARIEARRKREDAAFSQFFDHELEEEESNLRRRLKRLKRGLPPDESPQPGAARLPGSVSMSPPGQGLSTVPPPPKRHQVGPPGQPDAVNPGQSRPAEQRPAPPVKTSGPAAPYSFYRDSSSAYSRPYHQSGPYSTTPSTASPTTTTNGLSHHAQSSSDRAPLNHLARPASPRSRPASSNHSPATPVTSAQPPPRLTSSSYDTRPPPTTTSSGFASVNAPGGSGFATINPRSTATPPSVHAAPARPVPEVENKTPNQAHGSNGPDGTRFHSYTSTPTTTPTLAANTASKRTPSTTHPYQMSEAFANRHHHCERVDTLNRGIWTSYGVGGTQENPTGPATEMYLRCNHDGCSRIDWRTVHGLQCHIVKNHEQPKGTIGSLDKALEKYGVPVKEVEDYERDHGRGSAGTVADPKNHKIKIRTKEALNARPLGSNGSYPVDPQVRPAGYRPSPTPASNSPTLSEEIKRSPATTYANGPPKQGSGNENATRPTQAQPQTPVTASPNANKFTSLSGSHMRTDQRTDWLGLPVSLQAASRLEPDQKRLQGDFGASNLQSTSHSNVQPTVGPAKSEAQPRPLAAQSRPPVATAPGPAPLRAAGPALAPVPDPVPSTTSSVKPVTSEPLKTTIPEPTRPTTATLTSSTSGFSSSAPPIPEASKPLSDTKNVQPKQEEEIPAIVKHDTARLQQIDGDTHMTGTEEIRSERPSGEVNGGNDGEKRPAQPPSPSPEDNSEDQSETIVVDGETGKAINDISKKSGAHSPTITAKSLPASAPGSARRPSRRLSVARQSADGDGDLSYSKEYRSATATNGDADEKDDKDSKDEREKTPQRRFAGGRVLRRGRT